MNEERTDADWLQPEIVADATGNRPWLAQYDAGQPGIITPDFLDMLAMFRAATLRAADRPAAFYFDGVISYGALDRDSDALAGLLVQEAFQPGDRLALFMQNVPAFLVALLGTWKAGGIAVPINPMNRERALALLLADCTPRALICHCELYEQVVVKLPAALHPPIVLASSRMDYQTRNDYRLFPTGQRFPTRARDLFTALRSAGPGAPPPPPVAPQDPAMLVYTSGTTGVPKGAIITHANITFNAQTYRDWMGLPEGAAILGLAPLSHITGLVAQVATAFLIAGPIVLSCRFHPGVMLESIAEHRPVFTMGAITAFSAMMHAPDARADQIASLLTVGCGGSPVSPAIAAAFEAKFGKVILNGYGLTETASPTHLTPRERPARIDAASGAMSIGLPVYNTRAWIDAGDGVPAAAGVIGEIVVDGPMVSPGYWNKPQETAEFMRPDGFRTGDMGFMDADGWFYLVDRKKDLINTGGYKVWPREVEDVLCSHPAVREAAVVGVPDGNRGATVKAAVSLKPGATVTPDELIQWCRERMAVYEYPRQVEIWDELPKTVSGKITRRMIR